MRLTLWERMIGKRIWTKFSSWRSWNWLKFHTSHLRAINSDGKLNFQRRPSLTVKRCIWVILFWQQGFESWHMQSFLSVDYLWLFHNTEGIHDDVQARFRIDKCPKNIGIMRSYWNMHNLLIIGKCGIPWWLEAKSFWSDQEESCTRQFKVGGHQLEQTEPCWRGYPENSVDCRQRGGPESSQDGDPLTTNQTA